MNLEILINIDVSHIECFWRPYYVLDITWCWEYNSEQVSLCPYASSFFSQEDIYINFLIANILSATKEKY